MRNTYKRAFVRLVLVIISLLICLFLFNFYVNPYGVYDHSLLKHNQTEGRTNVRLVTAYNLKHKNFDGLILGSSRGSLGINPDSLYLKGNWYNGSLPGASLTEMFYYLQHAVNNNANLKTVVLGLDYYMLSPHARVYRRDFSLNRLDIDKKNAIYFKDFLDSSFAIDSLMSSIHTLQTYGQPGAFYKGMWLSPKRNFTADSVESVFAKTAEQIKGEVLLGEEKLDVLRGLLVFAQKYSIQVFIYLPPIHEFTKSYLNFSQLSEESIVRSLAQLIDEVNLNFQKNHIEFWNFANNNQITSLAFDKPKMISEFYFEGSHYTPETGDLILCRIFKYDECLGSNDFGYRVLPETGE